MVICVYSFLHCAILAKHENAVIAILRHERWRETMAVWSEDYLCATKYLIESMPRASLILLDNCTKSNDKPANHLNFAVRFLICFCLHIYHLDGHFFI